jgi:hypothetical protein
LRFLGPNIFDESKNEPQACLNTILPPFLVRIVFLYMGGTLWCPYSSDDDFIEAGLDGMVYSRRLYKKTIPNCKFIRGQFQIEFFKKFKHFTSCNVSKCPYGS